MFSGSKNTDAMFGKMNWHFITFLLTWYSPTGGKQSRLNTWPGIPTVSKSMTSPCRFAWVFKPQSSIWLPPSERWMTPRVASMHLLEAVYRKCPSKLWCACMFSTPRCGWWNMMCWNGALEVADMFVWSADASTSWKTFPPHWTILEMYPFASGYLTCGS